MREIKFRAWDRDSEQMITGFGLTPHDHYPYIIPENDESGDPASFEYYDNVELMQYTGLKDKNGKEIYEGDKLQTAPLTIREVIFKNGGFVGKDIVGMYADEKNRYKSLTDGHGEVIGNIYENEDLLNESIQTNPLPKKTKKRRRH